MDPTLVEQVEVLIESQGTDYYVALALDELAIEFVEDVPSEQALYFIGRIVALHEEEL